MKDLLREEDKALVNLTVQCLANLFCDQSRLAHHFVLHHPDHLRHLLSLTLSHSLNPLSPEEELDRSNVMRLLHLCFHQNF